jgi:hypothetical protein
VTPLLLQIRPVRVMQAGEEAQGGSIAYDNSRDQSHDLGRRSDKCGPDKQNRLRAYENPSRL